MDIGRVAGRHSPVVMKSAPFHQYRVSKRANYPRAALRHARVGIVAKTSSWLQRTELCVPSRVIISVLVYEKSAL